MSQLVDGSEEIRAAARLVRSARYLVAYTGAGISVESGVPPFRGPRGLWSLYDPRLLELSYFREHPQESWRVLREIFYEHLAAARPNEAHYVLARLEARGLLQALITQNIDGLHQAAGATKVLELHGNTRSLRCMSCGRELASTPKLLGRLPPRCRCGGVLKPELVFFGEGLPREAWERSTEAVRRADIMLVVGSTGEVYPAASLPFQAGQNGATIIEINPEPSNFTERITTVFIPMGASRALAGIEEALG
jgi:NAD-dependent deacetylase